MARLYARLLPSGFPQCPHVPHDTGMATTDQWKTPHRMFGRSVVLTSVCTAIFLAAASTVTPVRATPIFPESGFQLVYDLSIPDSASYNGAFVPYSVDNSGKIADGSFGRVGYLLHLQSADGVDQTVAVSMDAFTSKASMTGVPTVASGEVYNDVTVTNMNVISNVAGVANGTGLSTGFLQFWPDCYDQNGHGYATGTSFQTTGSACYGSMQIGNGVGNTVFAYNAWDKGTVSDLGIGNDYDPSNGNRDWTFADNASSYTIKDLSVWVQAASVPEPVSAGLLLSGLAGLIVARRHRRMHSR